MRKILVRGPALSRSGYGEHTRFILRSLKTREDIYDIHLINTNWGKCGWIYEDNAERRWLDSIILKTTLYIQNPSPSFDVSLQVTIPNEWEKLTPLNIGVTAGIETTKVSPEWVEKSQIVDNIITISEHSKNIYESTAYQAKDQKTGNTIENFKCQTPIEVVHYPVRKYEPVDIKLDFDTDFNFLAVAQWGPRKNLENTIKWFIEEFIDQEIGLIVKTFIVNNSVIDRQHSEERIKALLNEYPQRKCKIYLMHGDLTDEEMTALYQHPKVKALVTLTHGEGFGLPIFEAAYNALPVLAPDWSGHVDFLFKPAENKQGKIRNRPHFAKVDYNIKPIPKEVVWDGVLIKDSMWCYPKQGSYKMRLREIYKEYGRFKKQATTLQEWVNENFEESKQYKKIVDIVNLVIGEDAAAATEEIDVLFDKLMGEDKK